jgi:hypothetical protein
MQGTISDRTPDEEYQYWNTLSRILSTDAKLSRTMQELQARPKEKAARPKYTVLKAMAEAQEMMNG